MGERHLTAEIKSTDATFIAEVFISPKDVGHISRGMTTDIVVSTFDLNRFGNLQSVAFHTSEESCTDEVVEFPTRLFI